MNDTNDISNPVTRQLVPEEQRRSSAQSIEAPPLKTSITHVGLDDSTPIHAPQGLVATGLASGRQVRRD